MELFERIPKIKRNKKDKKKKKYFLVTIVEDDGNEIKTGRWAYSENQAKRNIAKDYNKKKGFVEDHYIQFKL
jgi:hypothetical protein